MNKSFILMTHMRIPVLSISFCILSSISFCQETEKFLPPVAPDGRVIRDPRALTGPDQPGLSPRPVIVLQDLPPHASHVPRTLFESTDMTGDLPGVPELESSHALEMKQQRFRKLQLQLQELNLLWQRMQSGTQGTQDRKAAQSEQEPSPPIPTGKTPEFREGETPSKSTTDLSTSTQSQTNPSIPSPTDEPIDASQPLESANSPNPQHEPARAVPTSQSDQLSTASTATTEANANSGVNANAGSIANAESKLAKENPSGTMTGPINRFALASSLFATQHHSECLQVLDSTDLTQLATHETIWVDYLRAGCYRHLGEIEGAQRLYRRIVAHPDSDWMGVISRWWLDQIQERQKLEQRSQQLASALEQWERTVHDISTPPR